MYVSPSVQSNKYPHHKRLCDYFACNRQDSPRTLVDVASEDPVVQHGQEGRKPDTIMCYVDVFVKQDPCKRSPRACRESRSPMHTSCSYRQLSTHRRVSYKWLSLCGYQIFSTLIWLAALLKSSRLLFNQQLVPYHASLHAPVYKQAPHNMLSNHNRLHNYKVHFLSDPWSQHVSTKTL